MWILYKYRPWNDRAGTFDTIYDALAAHQAYAAGDRSKKLSCRVFFPRCDEAAERLFNEFSIRFYRALLCKNWSYTDGPLEEDYSDILRSVEPIEASTSRQRKSNHTAVNNDAENNK